MSTDVGEPLSEATPDGSLTQLIHRVVETWEERPEPDRPYLVSALGLALSNDLKAIKELTGLNLTAFLRKHLADQMQLVRTGDHGNVYALVRPGSAPELVQQLPVGEARFNRHFWAAFAVPPKGVRRLIDQSDLTFEDDDGPLNQACAGKWNLDTTLIPAESAPNRDELIKTTIKAWLAEKGLDDGKFRVANRVERMFASHGGHHESSLLDLLVRALDKRQLQAVSLPLDVVAALLKRHP